MIIMKIDNELQFRLVLGEDIPFGAFKYHSIVQPTIDDVKYMEDKLNLLLYPFALTKEHLINIPKEIRDNNSTLDMLFLTDLFNAKNGQSGLMTIILEGLKFFFKTDNIKYFNEDYSQRIKYIDANNINNVKIDGTKFIIDSSTIINGENFDELSDLLLLITKREKFPKEEVESELNYINERARKAFEKIKQKELEIAKKEAEINSLPNLILNLQTITKEQINAENIRKMTLWQFYTKYSKYFAKESYDNTMLILSSGYADSKKFDTEHWSKKAKI